MKLLGDYGTFLEVSPSGSKLGHWGYTFEGVIGTPAPSSLSFASQWQRGGKQLVLLCPPTLYCLCACPKVMGQPVMDIKLQKCEPKQTFPFKNLLFVLFSYA